jgi:hemolysin-activating ACP:hemolysin acyltransferase
MGFVMYVQSGEGAVGTVGRMNEVWQGVIQSLVRGQMPNESTENPRSGVPGGSGSRDGALPTPDEEAIRTAFRERLRCFAKTVKGGGHRSMIGGDAVLSRSGVSMMRPPEHARIPIADLEWQLLPPLLLGQYKLHASGLVLVAFAALANFSEAVEERYRAGNHWLSAADWRSGDRTYLIHLVAPFGGAEAVVEGLESRVLAREWYDAIRRTG